MNHKVEYHDKYRFDSLKNGEFFVFNNNVYAKTSDNDAICFSRGSNVCFDQDCVFYPDSSVQKKDVTITVH